MTNICVYDSPTRHNTEMALYNPELGSQINTYVTNLATRSQNQIVNTKSIMNSVFQTITICTVPVKVGLVNELVEFIQIYSILQGK